ncbi:MAG: hypothetical protein D3924_10855 [Candidatus Electrothrix sp. AR4]|nr:hypothetical protein [Candidatus Electrothrix sp. AR4]
MFGGGGNLQYTFSKSDNFLSHDFFLLRGLYNVLVHSVFFTPALSGSAFFGNINRTYHVIFPAGLQERQRFIIGYRFIFKPIIDKKKNHLYHQNSAALTETWDGIYCLNSLIRL